MIRFCMVLLFAGFAAAWAQEPEPDGNVNSRYRVESVEIQPGARAKLSRTLREELQSQVGEKFSQEAMESLSRRIRDELRVNNVIQRVTRGSQPEHVKVTFEVVRKKVDLGLSVPMFVYHSRQGWSAEVESSARLGHNRFSIGLLSDGDTLLERQAGIRARYERQEIGSDRIRLTVEFGAFHQQWDQATLLAYDSDIGESDVYRTRHSFQPAITIVLARPLTLTTGLNLQRMQVQFPAAHTRVSNALINTLRYHRRLEGSGTDQEVDAAYTLHAATRSLSSDFSYTRHECTARYALLHGGHTFSLSFQGGTLGGTAPLFDRFILGNSAVLRGWNKFEVAPRGGNRLAYGSVEYRYRVFQVFYDTGSVWEAGNEPNVRHSVGGGLRKGAFSLALAFPLKEGRPEPVFIAGMNF